MRRRALLIIVVGLVWLNNTSIFFTPQSDTRVTEVIAHRGVHQVYAGKNRTAETCRAESVKPIQHHFVENTIASMKAAFDYGADVVELDVHLTTDNVLAVFHDWRLECQTNGQGVTHKQTYEYLKTLDVGYGFTDDGITYPLRGVIEEPIPSLEHVLEAELSGTFLINFKSGRRADGLRFVELMSDSSYNDKLFGVYGGENPVRTVSAHRGDIKGFDRSSLKSCIKFYLAIAWTGIVPSVCENRIIAIPINYARWLWGWPHRFTARMTAVNTQVILWGPYDGTGFSSGIDTVATLSRVPDKFDGYIWTNVIETIGPLVQNDDRF